MTALHDELVGREVARPGRDLAGWTAYLIAALVHLWTLAMAVGGVAMIVATWPDPLPWLPGFVLVAAAFMMRPRIDRLPADAFVVTRTDAPLLFGLVDRVTAELRGPRLDRIVLDAAFNASARRVGLRRRPVLTLGVPLWNILDPQERVDLLGHEVGHFVNRDLRRGLFLGSALTALARLHVLLLGAAAEAEGPAAFVARSLLRFLSLFTAGPYFVLTLLTLRSSQRAEYLADDLGARLATSDVTQRGLLALLLGEGCHNALASVVKRNQTARMWELEREYVASVPATERERLFRRAEHRQLRIDETHPPTHLRWKLVAERPRHVSARVVLGAAESRAIDVELAPGYAEIAQQVRAQVLDRLG